MRKRYDTARYLIEHGSATNIVAHDGNVVLSAAAAFGPTKIVKMLIQSAAKVRGESVEQKGKDAVESRGGVWAC